MATNHIPALISKTLWKMKAETCLAAMGKSFIFFPLYFSMINLHLWLLTSVLSCEFGAIWVAQTLTSGLIAIQVNGGCSMAVQVLHHLSVISIGSQMCSIEPETFYSSITRRHLITGLLPLPVLCIIKLCIICTDFIFKYFYCFCKSKNIYNYNKQSIKTWCKNLQISDQ